MDVGNPGTMLVSAGLTIGKLLEDEESSPANNYKHLSTGRNLTIIVIATDFIDGTYDYVLTANTNCESTCWIRRRGNPGACC